MLFNNLKKILCCECYKFRCTNRCDNCNKYICESYYCGIEFPHIENEKYNVCISCTNNISLKLKKIIKIKKLKHLHQSQKTVKLKY